MPVQSIVVHYIPEAAVIEAATANGWTDGESLLDYVNDPNDYTQTKNGFTSVAKAKAWGRRNHARDLWGAVEVAVYEWPSEPRRSWERRTVRHLRDGGAGYGWEELECDE